MDIDNLIVAEKEGYQELIKNHQDDMQYVYGLSMDKKKKEIRGYLKEKRLSVAADFEQWLEAENDESVLAMLHFLPRLKLYNRGEAFARQAIFMDKEYWEDWRAEQQFDLKKVL